MNPDTLQDKDRYNARMSDGLLLIRGTLLIFLAAVLIIQPFKVRSGSIVLDMSVGESILGTALSCLQHIYPRHFPPPEFVCKQSA